MPCGCLRRLDPVTRRAATRRKRSPLRYLPCRLAAGPWARAMRPGGSVFIPQHLIDGLVLGHSQEQGEPRKIFREPVALLAPQPSRRAFSLRVRTHRYVGPELDRGLGQFRDPRGRVQQVGRHVEVRADRMFQCNTSESGRVEPSERVGMVSSADPPAGYRVLKQSHGGCVLPLVENRRGHRRRRLGGAQPMVVRRRRDKAQSRPLCLWTSSVGSPPAAGWRSPSATSRRHQQVEQVCMTLRATGRDEMLGLARRARSPSRYWST